MTTIDLNQKRLDRKLDAQWEAAQADIAKQDAEQKAAQARIKLKHAEDVRRLQMILEDEAFFDCFSDMLGWMDKVYNSAWSTDENTFDPEEYLVDGHEYRHMMDRFLNLFMVDIKELEAIRGLNDADRLAEALEKVKTA